MPLYPYRCTGCGFKFEKIQKFDDEPLQECPKCHGHLERPLTAPRFQFKGSGWYVNDYGGKTSAPESSSTSTPTESKPAESKTETPASTPAPSAPSAAPAS